MVSESLDDSGKLLPLYAAISFADHRQSPGGNRTGKGQDMKYAPLAILVPVLIAVPLSVTSACGDIGMSVPAPVITEASKVTATDTVLPASLTHSSQPRISATHTPMPALTPMRTATPASQLSSGLGVSRYSVETGLEEVGFSFVSYASTGIVYGDSADGTASVKLFAPGDTLREATLQFYYTPALKPESVVLNSLIFTDLVLPYWSGAGEWLENAFERAANGEIVETSVNTPNRMASVMLEIIGDDTISLAITSTGSNNYALEIAGVTPTPVSTRASGVTRLVPKSIEVPKENSTPIVIILPTPVPTHADKLNEYEDGADIPSSALIDPTLKDPCGIQNSFLKDDYATEKEEAIAQVTAMACANGWDLEYTLVNHPAIHDPQGEGCFCSFYRFNGYFYCPYNTENDGNPWNGLREVNQTNRINADTPAEHTIDCGWYEEGAWNLEHIAVLERQVRGYWK